MKRRIDFEFNSTIQTQVRYGNKRRRLEFDDLPIHLILEILSYYEFSFQNCTDTFSFLPMIPPSSSSFKFSNLSISSQPPSNTTTVPSNNLDLSNPSQVFVDIMRQYKERRESELSSGMSYTASVPLLSSTTTTTQDVITPDMQALFIGVGDLGSKQEVDRHQLPDCTDRVIRLLSKHLYGKFSSDSTRTLYCIFLSVNIDTTNFPKMHLLKTMSMHERGAALRHVVSKEESSDCHNTSPNIQHINTTIQLLFLRHVQTMFRLLTRVPKILSVDVSGLSLGDGGVSQLKEHSNASRPRKLSKIDYSRNKLSDEGAIELCKIGPVKHLNLSVNDIGDKGASALFECDHIETLLLNYNNITDRTTKYLVNNCSLVTLDLSFNMINEEGIQCISQCKSLKKLCLKYMCLKNESMKSFSKATNLKVLDLSYNAIGDEGAKYLAMNTRLQELHLGFNNVGSQGALELFMNKNLKVLSLNNNRIYSDALRVVPINESLVSLDLSTNNIDDLGAILVTRNNNRLKFVDLANNYITFEGARHFLLAPYIRFNLKSQYTTRSSMVRYVGPTITSNGSSYSSGRPVML
jgi:Leucine-rich repeat (LRR) protein